MYTSEKTDSHLAVTKTTGVPILGRTQAKLMNYISYSEICAPKDQEQSPVSVNNLNSTDYVYSLETMDSSLQSGKTAHSTDSLKTTPTTDQTAKKSTELLPEQNQPQHMDLSLHKSPGTRMQSQ